MVISKNKMRTATLAAGLGGLALGILGTVILIHLSPVIGALMIAIGGTASIAAAGYAAVYRKQNLIIEKHGDDYVYRHARNSDSSVVLNKMKKSSKSILKSSRRHLQSEPEHEPESSAFSGIGKFFSSLFAVKPTESSATRYKHSSRKIL